MGPEYVGLIPAGGVGQRLQPLPCSKEIFPVGAVSRTGQWRPKPVMLFLLEAMARAGARKAVVVIRPGKWDIPGYLKDTAAGLALAYVLVTKPWGPAFTLDAAYPFVAGLNVFFGFPDILFSPLDAFSRLAERQRRSRADIVLGTFPTTEPEKVGVVQVDDAGTVLRVMEKPQPGTPGFMWCLAVWGPRFTWFLHEWVARQELAYASMAKNRSGELVVGDAIQAALGEGFRVEAEHFPEGRYLDTGTPEGLRQASAFVAQLESADFSG